MVHYRAIDLVRRTSTIHAAPGSDCHVDDRLSPDDPSELALRREQTNHVLSLLDKLPDAQREVITLAFYGQLTHTELADQLDLPSGTVKGRMRFGMHKLRADLEPADP